jgi:hypothetical protein
MRACALLMLLTACTVPVGQKVRALLVDETLTCREPEGGGDRIAVLALDQEGDLYTAELVEVATGKRFSIPSVREGLDVTFTCPAGIDSVTVRRATVLESTRDATTEDAGRPAP